MGKDLFSMPVRQFEDAILAYWTMGMDTSQIARRLGAPEGAVANALPRVLEMRRKARLAAGRQALRHAERVAVDREAG